MRLERTDYLPEGIFGILHVTDELKFSTLEHSYECLPKLPCGTYKCVRGTHRLESMISFETFEITGVEGHTGILFHQGNYNKDSNGCVLVGEYKENNMIFQSRKAFKEFMNALDGVTEFELEVI